MAKPRTKKEMQADLFVTRGDQLKEAYAVAKGQGDAPAMLGAIELLQVQDRQFIESMR